MVSRRKHRLRQLDRPTAWWHPDTRSWKADSESTSIPHRPPPRSLVVCRRYVVHDMQTSPEAHGGPINVAGIFSIKAMDFLRARTKRRTGKHEDRPAASDRKPYVYFQRVRRFRTELPVGVDQALDV